MKLSDAYPAKFAAEQERTRRAAALKDVGVPVLNLCGPETLTSLVREIKFSINGLAIMRAWDDPLDRWLATQNQDDSTAVCNSVTTNKLIVFTVEKIRGRWTVIAVRE